MAANPKPSKLAAALNYLQQIASMRGEATPNDYQERLGLRGDVTPSMSTVTQAARDFGGGVATNLVDRARDIAPVMMETVDPRALQARPATVKMLGDVASIGKAIVTDPIGTGKSIVSGEADRAKLAMNNPRSMGEYAGSFIDPLRIASALSKRPSIAELNVYHGTPHRFPPTENNPLGEFDASKIGTGEGMQAYGHGVYLAEAPEVAKGYATILANRDLANQGRLNAHANAKRLANLAGESKAAADDIRYALESEPNHSQKELLMQTLQMLESGEYKQPLKNTGNLYKADLPDEQIAKMLDWDKPLSEQQGIVGNLTPQAMGLKYTKLSNGRHAFLNSENKVVGNLQINGTPESFEKNWMKNVMQGTGRDLYIQLNRSFPSSEKGVAPAALLSANIPGIRYLEAGSRGTGKGTRNFVVFPGEEKKVRILERK